jgi:hypothetical protein
VSIPPESLEVGKCYLAKGGRSLRIRRLVQLLPDGRVQYEQRSPKTAWQMRIQVRDVFASMLQREVPCDWTPEAEGAKP